MSAERKKSVKAEVEDEEEKISLVSLVKNSKKKSFINNGKSAKVKKEEYSDEEDDEPVNKKSSKKGEKDVKVKKKMKKKEEESGVAKKREKKVFDLPGQKRDPPEERDPLRIFYESLYQQVPTSEMAAFWMMESGLLPLEVAKKVYEKKQKKNQQLKLRSPIKAVSSVTKTSRTVTVKKTTSSQGSSVKSKITQSKTTVKQSKSGDQRSTVAPGLFCCGVRIGLLKS
ncbi:hypothetical protein Syun_015798 [Stephania yunnanensis]|uniref:Uncharacterized protein n=1 Tax=Stephania yunnanensis TaxID=152371 RepID=A0AAP0JLV9_9MAGN